MRHTKILIWVIAAASACSSGARACSVPVFRYALERWENAPYQAVIFHRGPLADADKHCLETLKNAGDAPKGTTNIVVDSVDVDTLAGLKPAPNAAPGTGRAMAKLWAAQKNPALPWTVLLYPQVNDDLESFWSGPLNPERIARLIASPARTEIARKLTAGDSVVWAVLLSGDKQKDDGATKMLETELAKLQKTIALPTDADTQGGPVVRRRSDLPLKISFSIVPVSRTDPAEAMFAAMLIGIDKRFRDAAQPAAFPIFGRGRALTGLLGKDFATATIGEATVFLTGACSCQVKELNPGVDLLFNTDWEGLVSGGKSVENSKAAVEIPVPKLPAPAEKKPVETIDKDSEKVASNGRVWLLAGLLLSGAMAIVMGTWLLKLKRKQQP